MSTAGKKYVIAVDIGTTSTKTLVIDRDGRILAERSIEYPLLTPRPGEAVQDPDEMHAAAVDGIAQAVGHSGIAPHEVLCVSFSSAMHSLIAVDAGMKPLTPCITWADSRSARQADELKRSGQGQRIYAATGTPIHPMSPLTKLMWMREHEPALFGSAHKFIGIKEYVFAKLFGRYVIDHSLASATGMFNLNRLAWDEEALALAGIDAGRLSEPVPTTTVLQGLRREDVERMGISPDTPFVVGASDGVLANLGVGAFEPGVWAVTVGTSGAVRAVVPKPVTDPHGRLFCYALKEDFWVVGGAINNGGIMLRWVRDQLATLEAEEARRQGVNPYDRLTDLAGQVPAGADGLLFLPLLTGERAPYWNANARGLFFGLSLYHQKKHMIRAVLEGVAFQMGAVAVALASTAGHPGELRASGGFARSTVWRQIMADVLGAPLTVPDAIESSGLGAAQLGLLAVGEIRDFRSVHDWVSAGTRHEPNESNRGIYRELSAMYGRVYDRLIGEFDAIATFQQQHVRL